MKKTTKKVVIFFLIFSLIVGMGASSYTQEIVNAEDLLSNQEEPEVNPEESAVIPEDPPVNTEEPPVTPEEPPVIPVVQPVIPVAPTANITINHIQRSDIEELLIETEIIEGLEVGMVKSSLDFVREYEGLSFVESDIMEIVLVEGENIINLYYESLSKDNIGKINLIINFIEIFEDQEEILDIEIIEGLQIGNIISSLDYIREFEGLMFLRSDPEEILLVAGENIINLYYSSLPSEYIAEAPDFPPGEGMEVEAPYIQEFNYGELGPFEEIEEFSEFRFFNLIELNSYSDEVNNKTWPNPGSLLLNKSGTEVLGTGNQWEIKLEVQGKNKVETSDIVLVIDRSGSMSGTKMADAKAAAISFVNTLLNDPSKTNIRIAVVSFAENVTTDSVFQGYSGKASLITTINGLNASGGTHIQAGIRQANALLNGSTATYKNIVLLGDGAATYSYKPNSPNGYLEYWKTEDSRKYYRTTSNIPETGFNYSSNVGTGYYDHDQYEFGGTGKNKYSNNYRHGAHAVAEAGFGKAKGYIFYTIALNAGTEGNWTLGGIASPGNYYSTPSSSNLNIIFQEIAGNISNAATNVVVTDPLGDMYDILGINASNYNSLITVSHGTLSYDAVTEKITWNIGTITEGTIYWMKYKVALDYSAEGGVYYPANKPTYINYKNIDGDNAKKYFPIPEFRLRELQFTKILTDGKPADNNKQFNIILEGPSGPYKKTWTVSLKPGQSKKIKGLLPGTYIVKEIVPMNFKLIGMNGSGITSIGNSYQLVVGNNDWKMSVDITNKRDNDGWFWDDPDPKINSFTVGNQGGTQASLPFYNRLYVKLDYFILPSDMGKDYKLYNL